jgi:hypothetical protein
MSALSSNLWQVNHGLNTRYVNLDVIVLVDGKYQTIWPKQVTLPDENSAVISFTTPQTGFVRIGG